MCHSRRGIHSGDAVTGNEEPGDYQIAGKGDCLPKSNLVDQHGQSFSLDSLKGKPVLVDFIFTSCPGPCLMLTAKFANVALRLGPDLGSKVGMLSVSVDPEHDTPQDMLKYSKDQGADEKGWEFVTGSPAEIDRVMSAFKLQREHDSDGTIGHVADMFLVGRDGRELREYNGSVAKPERIVEDMKKALGTG